VPRSTATRATLDIAASSTVSAHQTLVSVHQNQIETDNAIHDNRTTTGQLREVSMSVFIWVLLDVLQFFSLRHLLHPNFLVDLRMFVDVLWFEFLQPRSTT